MFVDALLILIVLLVNPILIFCWILIVDWQGSHDPSKKGNTYTRVNKRSWICFILIIFWQQFWCCDSKIFFWFWVCIYPFCVLIYRIYIIGSKLFLLLLICEWQRVFCNTKEYDNLRSVFLVFSAMYLGSSWWGQWYQEDDEWISKSENLWQDSLFNL